MLVVGEREAESETVSVRPRTGDDLGALPVPEVAERIAALSASRSRDL
jgi:threonyl-tRNA synthetase